MTGEHTLPPPPPSNPPELDLRHQRLHVVHEGAQYTVYIRQQLERNRSGEALLWRTIEHVIDDGSESYHGLELGVPRERIALLVNINSDEFETAKRRTE